MASIRKHARTEREELTHVQQIHGGDECQEAPQCDHARFCARASGLAARFMTSSTGWLRKERLDSRKHSRGRSQARGRQSQILRLKLQRSDELAPAVLRRAEANPWPSTSGR